MQSICTKETLSQFSNYYHFIHFIQFADDIQHPPRPESILLWYLHIFCQKRDILTNSSNHGSYHTGMSIK